MVGNDDEETRSMVGKDDNDVEEEEEERPRGVVHWQVVKKKQQPKNTCLQTGKTVLSSGLLDCNILFVLEGEMTSIFSLLAHTSEIALPLWHIPLSTLVR